MSQQTAKKRREIEVEAAEEQTLKPPTLGIKRECGGCAIKFYDFGKSEIVCPKCRTPIDPNAPRRKRRKNVSPVEHGDPGLPIDDSGDSRELGGDDDLADEVEIDISSEE